MVCARIVSQKGAAPDQISTAVEFLKELGHVQLVLQCDAEPALKALLDQAQRAICQGGNTSTRQVRVRVASGHASNSNGAAERGIRTIKGLVRTFASDVEARLSGNECRAEDSWKLTPSSGLLDYVLRRVVWVRNMYHVPRKAGKTAYEQHTGRAYEKNALRFLKPVQAIDDRLGARKAIAGRTHIGAWLGRADKKM